MPLADTSVQQGEIVLSPADLPRLQPAQRCLAGESGEAGRVHRRRPQAIGKPRRVSLYIGHACCARFRQDVQHQAPQAILGRITDIDQGLMAMGLFVMVVTSPSRDSRTLRLS